MSHSFWLSSYELLPDELTVTMDEAGRWPLAWPVTVWGIIVCAKVDESIRSTRRDSKQLKADRRELVYEQLLQEQSQGRLLVATGEATAHEIDQYGIIRALQKASLQMIAELLRSYLNSVFSKKLLQTVRWEDHVASLVFSQYLWDRRKDDRERLISFIKVCINQPQSLFVFRWLLIDGNHTFWLDKLLWCRVQTIIKWDQKVPLISAASIAAKVIRDRTMVGLTHAYPERWFDQHKGYGTKNHRQLILKHAHTLTPEHRKTFLYKILKQPNHPLFIPSWTTAISQSASSDYLFLQPLTQKPKLLLHICCAPDLSRPLRRLKNTFKLYLFRYNPNIHPKPEHDKRYAEFVKLFQLEGGDYEIVEDRYEPKEFFDAFVKHKELVDSALVDADRGTVLKQAGVMKERSDRCNPCYLMRLEQAAKQAQKLGITYFTSTLLISPKKLADKLFQYGLESQQRVTWTKFLRFDFAKKGWYDKASEITKQYGLYRQNYCGCGRTIPKKWETQTGYRGG